jgi:hypothetical protein
MTEGRKPNGHMTQYIIFAIMAMVGAGGGAGMLNAIYPPFGAFESRLEQRLDKQETAFKAEMERRLSLLALEIQENQKSDAEKYNAIVKSLFDIQLKIGTLPLEEWRARIRSNERWIDRHDHGDEERGGPR